MHQTHNPLAVGVAQVDITPDYPIRLSGYGSRRTESEGIIQRLWAKALAIGSDTEEPVIVVTVENCGLPDELTEAVAHRVKQKTGLSARILSPVLHIRTAHRALPTPRLSFSVQIFHPSSRRKSSGIPNNSVIG